MTHFHEFSNNRWNFPCCIHALLRL